MRNRIWWLRKQRKGKGTMLIQGKSLTQSQRRIVLAAFVYRWTRDNEQRERAWAGIKGKPTVALQSDEEWLREHAFHFVNDGSRLMANRRHAEPAYLAGGE